MHRNVGKEIKGLTTVYTVLYSIGLAIVGALAGLYLEGEQAAFALGALGFVIGIVIGSAKAMWRYAYGDIADNLQQIREMLQEFSYEDHAVRHSESLGNIQDKVVRGSRYCETCGTQLHDNALFCHICGMKVD